MFASGREVPYAAAGDSFLLTNSLPGSLAEIHQRCSKITTFSANSTSNAPSIATQIIEHK